MTTQVFNNAEGGTNGTGVTTANSGGASGTAFSNAATSGTAGTTCTYDTAAKAHGILGYRVTPVSGGGWKNRLLASNTVKNFQCRFSLKMDGGLTTVTTGLVDLLDGSSVIVAEVLGTTAGKLRLTASGIAVGADSGVLSTIHHYRVEVFGTIGTTTSNGVITMRIYQDDDEVTPFFTTTSSTANLGTGTFNFVNFGKTTNSTHALAFALDDLAVGDAAASEFGAVGNLLPVADAGAALTGIEPWYPGQPQVTLDGSNSTDADGTITTYAWTQTAGSPTVTLTGAATAQATFNAPLTASGVTLTFQLTVTDNLGGTGTDTTTAAILPATEYVLVSGVWQPAQMLPIPY